LSVKQEKALIHRKWFLNISSFTGQLFLALFLLGFSKPMLAVGYVTDVKKKVHASLEPHVEKHLVRVGVQLPNDTKLSFSEKSSLEVFCPYSFEIKEFSNSLNDELCPGPEKKPSKMRSDGQRDAPVLISPRNKEVLTLNTVIWGVAKPSQFRILVREFNGKDNPEVFSSDIVAPIKTRDYFPIYRYELNKIINKSLEPNKVYQIIIYDQTTGKDSSSDKDFNGLVKLLSKEEKKKRIKPFPTVFSDTDRASYMKAVVLKEQGFLSDAYLNLGTIQGNEYNHLVKYQESQIFIEQNVPTNFTAFKLIRAIQYASKADDFLTAYMACESLEDIFFRLSDDWRKQISNFKGSHEFNKACPLFK